MIHAICLFLMHFLRGSADLDQIWHVASLYPQDDHEGTFAEGPYCASNHGLGAKLLVITKVVDQTSAFCLKPPLCCIDI